MKTDDVTSSESSGPPSSRLEPDPVPGARPTSRVTVDVCEDAIYIMDDGDNQDPVGRETGVSGNPANQGTSGGGGNDSDTVATSSQPATTLSTTASTIESTAQFTVHGDGGGAGVGERSTVGVEGVTAESPRKPNIRQDRKRKLPGGSQESSVVQAPAAVSTYDKIRLVIQPWLKPEGSINKPVLKMMLESVLLFLMMKPGTNSAALAHRYSPYVQPMVLHNIIEILEELGCVKQEHMRKTRASLFSPAAVPTIAPEAEEGDITVYIPTETCLLRLGQFSREMYPTAKWPLSEEYS